MTRLLVLLFGPATMIFVGGFFCGIGSAALMEGYPMGPSTVAMGVLAIAVGGVLLWALLDPPPTTGKGGK